MAEQNLQNLFSVKAADINEDCREYCVLSKRRKLQKWKVQFAHEIEDARQTATATSPLHSMQDHTGPEEIDLAQQFAEKESSP